MQSARFSLFVGAFLAQAFSSEITSWEKYIAYPSSENAKAVQSIQYSEEIDQKSLGEKISADLQILSIQVSSGDLESFRAALRLIKSTAPGSNLEDLMKITGRFIRQNPKAYLEDVKIIGPFNKCPGANFLGQEFVDRDDARTYEINARIKALESVQAPALMEVRNVCLSELKNNR